ncbi:hypothetical protein ACFZBP_37900 [Streptomyces sp. NPDC008086]|uniref:hypothetical protein n=1 Tax=Streptomyces sp. NPDC008086 TaxID=3364807 RepID=UPI0036E8D558
MLEGLTDFLAQQRQDVGRVGVGQMGRGDFQHQLADRVRTGGEVIDGAAQCGDPGSAP